MSILEISDGTSKMTTEMRISRSGSTVAIPVSSLFATYSEGRYPNKTVVSGVEYRAHLEKGDTIEFGYVFKAGSSVGSVHTKCEAKAGYYMERTG